MCLFVKLRVKPSKLFDLDFDTFRFCQLSVISLVRLRSLSMKLKPFRICEFPFLG